MVHGHVPAVFAKKEVPPIRLARDEVTQKNRLVHTHKIRTPLGQDDNVTLADEVECDEAYMGGREKNKHEDGRPRGRSTTDQTRVQSQWCGRVVAKEGCRHWLQHPFGSHTTSM